VSVQRCGGLAEEQDMRVFQDRSCDSNLWQATCQFTYLTENTCSRRKVRGGIGDLPFGVHHQTVSNHALQPWSHTDPGRQGCGRRYSPPCTPCRHLPRWPWDWRIAGCT
jgi:hypothetical protein